MNINYKQSQFELFSKNPDQKPKSQSKALSLNIALTLENLVIFLILSIIVLLFSFSVGVERGKRLARSEFEKGVENPVAHVQAQHASSLTEQEPVTKAAKIALPVVTAPEQNLVESVSVVKSDPVTETPDPGGYTIQVASFKLNKYALEEAETLKEKGYKAFVLKRGSYSIVCVGQFNDKKEAQRFAVPLKERYGDYLVRSL